MSTHMFSDSIAQNRRYYEHAYSQHHVDDVVECCLRYERLLKDNKRYMPEGFYQLYYDDLERQVAGKQVLELGFGAGVNALLLARLGASVVAVEIAEASVDLLEKAASKCGVSGRVRAIAGDFGLLDFHAASFDLVIGKAFLHHLTHEQEYEYLQRASRILKSTGEARFLEPAINIPLFDRLRFWIPVRSRPSKWRRSAFDTWKTEVDRHPDRDNSSRHFKESGEKFFEEVTIHTWDGLSRFLVFFSPSNRFFRNMRKTLIDIDHRLPASIQYIIARSQTIHMRKPRVAIK